MVKKIDDKMFWAIKALTDAGSTIPEIAKVLPISQSAISRVRQAKDPKEYAAMMKTFAAKNNKRRAERRAAQKPAEAPQKPAPAPEKPAEAPQKPAETRVIHQTDNHTFELLKEQNELLKSISAKLAFIVEQLA